ncbi:MAG: DUF58 domain-containing protein [Mariniblastus sp.]
MKLKQLAIWMIRIGSHDFCPWCNGLTDWLKEPLGWVVSAIAFSLLVGLLIGPQGFILAFAFLALLVLGLAWPWLSMKGIHCQLILPDRRVEENQELEVVFRVKNFWPLPVFGLMVKGEFLQECNKDESVAFSLKRVGAWSESEFRLPLIPRRRGKLPSGKVSVASGFPFGLMDISKTVDAYQPTLVWPTCVPLDGFPVSDSSRFCLEGALRDRAGNDGDSIGVRAYRFGDRLKNIHWAQSARSQKLMVRERQSISSTGATVFLDLTPGDHVGHGSSSSFEWTIRIAASICSHLHETHSPVRIIAFGLNGTPKHCEDNRNGLRPIMDFLANLPSLADATNLTDMSKSSNVSQEQQSEAIHSFSTGGNGHLFAIGTSESKQIQLLDSCNPASNVTPVVVDIEGFKSEDKLASHRKTDTSQIASNNRSGKSDSVLIATPHAAAEALVSGWSRSFSDAV